ncbi:hypothetical protein TH53_17915 [Pedobacter lusitanus]|uniref:Uncharacterized protein n=1 Tax=Pedobacter lusitanus TaxID=1503925 RepID=A0A0D0F309_9SPHI|nr:hypothetical protein [Pedobacter lusitanus]KIO75938.1 hypothetical protein TH53_17915 [Pedobacter lusitanus]
MAKQTLNIIKNWFRTGLKPSQQQFWDTWDSFWHKDAIIPSGNIENLDLRFDQKADAEALNSHIKDQTAHGLNQKAGLTDQNIFAAENTFINKIRVPKVLTDTGIDFNLDLKNKMAVSGFAGKLTFGIEDGTLSFTGTRAAKEGSADPSFAGAQFRISSDGDTDIQGKLNASGLSFPTADNFYQYISPAAITTENTEVFLPALSGTLARTADIPVLTAGDNITITGTALNPVINATGGGGPALISVTYEELNTLIETSKLIPEQQYLLSDFQSTFIYGNHFMDEEREAIYFGSEVYSGDIEPLILKALSKNQLYLEGKSTVYQSDEVLYSIENQKRGILASTKGTLLRRIDKEFNNTANFDYRVTRYKTNGEEPKQALYLTRNCTIDAFGRYDMVYPVVIREMENSYLKSYEGTIMNSLRNSKLDIGYRSITSSMVNVYGCEITGPLFGMWKSYKNVGSVSLSYIYANTVEYIGWMTEEDVIKHLANKSYPSYVVQSGNAIYLQNNESTGVTTTLISYVPV